MLNKDAKIVENDAFSGIVSDENLRMLVGYNMKRAFNAVQADLLDALRPFELRMITYSALVLIVDNPGLRQSHLSSALAVERPNLVVIIDQLERRGLISRERLASDRRAYGLHATLAGRKLYEDSVRAVTAHEVKIFGALDGALATNLVADLRGIESRAKGNS
ncbi:MAG: MarR family transcriptional regulator [Robiginitomaculum sp.]|nr:MAG: MarR family transcriptional regulator [Robiginitomaculum sp.]